MRRLAILAAVAGALGAYLLLVELRRPSPDVRRAEARRLCPGLDRRAVTGIVVGRPAGAFTLVRDAPGGDVWTVAIAGAAKRPAASGAVADLLSALDAAEIDRAADVGGAAAGLEHPVATLEIAATGDRAWRLEIGGADASGRGVFVRRAGAAGVVVTGSHIAVVADRPADAFRDRRLVPDPAALAGIRELDWSRPAAPARSVTLEGGLWRDERRLRVAHDRVEAAARALAEREATALLPVLPPLPSAALEVTASGGPGGIHLTLAFGGDGDDDGCPAGSRRVDRALGRVPDSLCLATADVDVIGRALELAGTRDLALVAARSDEIVQATVVLPARPALTLSRAPAGGAGWRLDGVDAPWPVDPDEIERWLAALTSARLQPVDGPPGPRAQPIAASGRELTLQRRDGASERFQWTDGPGQQLLIQRSDERRPAAAPASLRASLAVEALAFRDRHPLRLARYDVERLGIRDRGAPAAIGLRKDAAETWHLAAGADGKVDGAALDQLLASVTNLTAGGFLPPETRLAVARTLEIFERRDPSTVTHRLDVGNVSRAGCTARLTPAPPAPPAVFTLDPPACAALTASVTPATPR